MSIIDIVAAFNIVCIQEGNKEKIVFQTQYRLYKYIVILFSLYNTLGTFQTFINKILRKYLDNFYTTYLDNMLIYSKREEDYKNYMLKVLQKLKELSLYLDLRKYKFKKKQVKYLGLILITNSIKIDLRKVVVIKDQ